jgi:hypothetical protein
MEKKKKMENVVVVLVHMLVHQQKNLGSFSVCHMCFCMSSTDQRPLTLALGKLEPTLVPWV